MLGTGPTRSFRPAISFHVSDDSNNRRQTESRIASPPVRVPRRRVRARPGRKAGASAHAGRDRAS
ncbi:hypothetical protein HMPREF0724_10754 [Prescottella equi ATCC 33707]|uniref:Uncharacterized protein n=1 Tax=Prescottella equi ATCC 33707 TaxID=525370 RepID=E9SXA3_RHOHA|nr:hypothetical protein HMPREF0724_10754 [Prescottella equi ATCC 33707]